MTDEELRKLVEEYQPNPDVIKAMSNVRLVATVGPSASGKSTIMKTLATINPNFHFVVGETSRQPRQDEQNGVDLLFRSRAEILNDLKNGALTQVVIGPNGDLYCTRVDNFPTQGIDFFPLIPLGVKQFRALPLKFFAAAFIVPASFELWQEWLNKQAKTSGWTNEQVQSRLAEAKQSFEFALTDREIRFVLNDTPDQAAKRLRQVAHGHPPDDEEQARKVAAENFAKLKLKLGLE